MRIKGQWSATSNGDDRRNGELVGLVGKWNVGIDVKITAPFERIE